MTQVESQEFKVASADYDGISGLVVLEQQIYANDAYPALFFYQALRQWPQTFLIVKKAGIAAGYSLLAPVSDGTLSLMSVLVGKEYQGQGLGAKLLHESINRARSLNYQKIELSVAPDNIPAIALYNSLGFSEAGRLSDYLGPDQDRIIMVLVL